MKGEILETLENKRDYYRQMASMCDDILNGKSMKSVCEENGFTVPTFRGRIFRNDMKPVNTISREEFLSSIEKVMSPEERILCEILDRRYTCHFKPNQTFRFPEDFEETLFRLMDEVTDHRTREIVRLRYYEEMSFGDIGKEFGLSVERIRQILVRFWRDMQRGDRFLRLIYGDKEYEKYRDSIESCVYIEKLLKDREVAEKKRPIYEKLMKELEIIDDEIKPVKGKNDGIENLDIDVRTFNALKRSGVNTVEDVLKLTDAELLRTRNFGLSCLANLNDALAKRGLTRG